MTLKSHAENELDAIGMTADSSDDMNQAMREHILRMVDEFSKEGHSGFSASYAVNLLSKLLKYEPLCPLTGEDSEWVDVAEHSNGPRWQNKRCSHVFKDPEGAYDIDGKVFYTWETYEDGEKFKSYFTNRDSHVRIEFPYTPVTEYVESK